MKLANIQLGSGVEVDPSSTINNVILGKNVKIAKRCSIFGSEDFQLEIGANSYVGMNSFINGYKAKVLIGKNVSIAQNVCIMVDSGPNASVNMQKVFPIVKGPITIESNCWIGTNSIIMPNVTLGEYCIVAANSFVNRSFSPFSIIGGNPATLIRSFSSEEVEKMLRDD
jgi:acetyltransferase-like isoleucine patch superfamily enzyme